MYIDALQIQKVLAFFGVLQVWTKISAWQIDHLPRSMTRSQTRREVSKIPGGTSSLAKAIFFDSVGSSGVPLQNSEIFHSLFKWTE